MLTARLSKMENAPNAQKISILVLTTDAFKLTPSAKILIFQPKHALVATADLLWYPECALSTKKLLLLTPDVNNSIIMENAPLAQKDIISIAITNAFKLILTAKHSIFKIKFAQNAIQVINLIREPA